MTRSRTPVPRRRVVASPAVRRNSPITSTIPAARVTQASPALNKHSPHVSHVFSKTPAAPTLFDMIWISIATPGAGPGLIAAVNGSLCIFLTAICYFSAVGDWDGIGTHMAVLCFLAIGLLVSFNVFIGMVSEGKGKR
jgi:hypothetical protein